MNLKVLIIEDSNMLRQLLQVVFEREGIQVLTAASGKIGIQVARQEQPDVILLDLVMPVADGFRVFESILANEETADIPVVFFSNFSTQEDREKALGMGAADFIVKSQSPPTELVGKLKDIAARR